MDGQWKRPRCLVTGALLAALALGIQAAPFYLPVIGFPLSSLSTMPVALAAYLNGVTGLLTYLVAGLLLSFWSVPRALFFCLGAGLLGLSLGVLMRRRIRFIYLVCISGTILTLGLFFAALLLEVPLIPWMKEEQRLLLVPVMLIWSSVYAAIWVPVLGVILVRLRQFFND